MNYKFPTPREVDRELYKNKLNLSITCVRFPAPREVDRELNLVLSAKSLTGVCFRPLSRQIGIYTFTVDTIQFANVASFRPLAEVYWELYRSLDWWGVQVRLWVSGPSRGRQGAIHSDSPTHPIEEDVMFPAPREVGSYTLNKCIDFTVKQLSFRPLSRQIGIYTLAGCLIVKGLKLRVSGPSRGRQGAIRYCC